MRRVGRAEAKRLRARNSGTIWAAGTLMAIPLSVPLVNLLIPIWLMMLATFDRLLFPRTELRWVERLVHYLFAAGTYLLVATTLIPVIKLWPMLHFVNFIVIFGLVIWACIGLHRRSAWNVIKSLVMVPVSFFLYVFLSSLLVALLLGIPVGEVFVRSNG